MEWFAGAAYAQVLVGWAQAVGVVPLTSTGGVLALSLWVFRQTGSPVGEAVRQPRR